MKKLLLTLFVLVFAFAANSQVKFIATGLTCSMCSKAIHDALTKDSTVSKVDVNLQTQVWKVDLKEGVVFDKMRIVKIVEGAGFSVSKMWYKDLLVLNKTNKRLRVWSL